MSLKQALIAGTATLALASPAASQERSGDRGSVQVAPYVEVGQLLDWDLNNGDAVTYTTLAAGVDVSADTARTSAQLSYRYQHNFSWEKGVGDDDLHLGLARVAARVTNSLTLEAGGLATRTRSDIRGAAPGLLLGNNTNVSQLYSLYAGPSLSTTLGAFTVGADYRIGYTKVETPGFDPAVIGQPRRDYYDDSLGNVATARIGFAPGTLLPVGLTASGGYVREDAGQLGQRFEDAYGRVDALLPVFANLALQGGVGYEKITSSSRAPLVNAVTGVPVTDGNGRFVTDPASPRRVDYRTDGVYFDAGVVWRPNRRTSVSGAVGRRYGSTIYTGQATWAASRSVGVAVNLYDSVETFGNQLRDNIGALPTSFVTARDLYSQQFNGCIFGTSGAAPGSCLNSVLQSITTATYRTRGLDAVVTATRGLNTYGFGAGYVNRKLFSRANPGVSVFGIEDESYYAQGFYSRRMSPVSTVDLNLFANYFDPGQVNSDGVWSYGAVGSYNRSFGRISTTASAGLYSFKVGDLPSDWSAQAQLAARYTF